MLSPKAAKYLERLHEPAKARIKTAIENLENEPLRGNVKPMTGEDGFRLRVGRYRVLFGIRGDIIVVTDIGLRGQIYKRR